MKRNILLIFIKVENLLDTIIDTTYDLFYQIETRKIEDQKDLHIDSTNLKNAKKYQATRKRLFKNIIGNLNININNYNFIDLGSGKGKAIILASRYPFKNIIGIEFSNKLHQMAQNNIKKFNKNNHINLQCKDIMNFIPPNGANIFYLYNPINDILLGTYFNNLINKNLFKEGDIIIYLNPRHHKELDKLKLKREVLISNFNFNKIALTYTIK